MLIDIQKDESESFGDVLNLLKVGIAKYEVVDNSLLLKTMSKCLSKVEDLFPEAIEVTRKLLTVLLD